MPARVLPLLLLLFPLAACSLRINYDGSSFHCDDGACPDGFVCNAALLCVSAGDAVDAAPSAPDAADVDAAAAAGCRNGVVEPGEACDDGNTANGDSCSATCQLCAGGVSNDANGHCYVWPTGVIGWHAAVDACAGLGGYLASLTDVSEILFASLHAPAFPYWVGLNDIAVEGTYVWYDGEPQLDAAIPWLPNQPNGGNDNNDCIWAESSGFNDLGCTTGTTAHPLCESDGWHVRASDGHAYRFVYVTGTSASLESECEGLGARLATLETSSEATFLGGFATGSFWVAPAASQGTCPTVELAAGGGVSSTGSCTGSRFGVCEIE